MPCPSPKLRETPDQIKACMQFVRGSSTVAVKWPHTIESEIPESAVQRRRSAVQLVVQVRAQLEEVRDSFSPAEHGCIVNELGDVVGFGAELQELEYFGVCLVTGLSEGGRIVFGIVRVFGAGSLGPGIGSQPEHEADPFLVSGVAEMP